MKWICFFILPILLIFACEGKQNSPSNLKIGRSAVQFNVGLRLLSNGMLVSVDSVLSTYKGKKKIVSIVDGICMKCVINDLNQADEVFQQITASKKVIYILNVTSADSAYFIANLEPLIKVKGHILWDDSYSFENTNGLLSSDKNLRTFLLDEQNNIKLIGNPLYNPDLVERYKEAFEE